MPLQGYANYAIGSPQVGFFFRVEPPTVLYMFGVCSGVCFLLSGALPDTIFTPGGLKHWGLHSCNPLEFTHGRHICNPGDGHWPTPSMHRVAAPSTTLSRGSLLLLCLLFSHYPIYMVGHTALGAWQSHQSLHLPYMVEMGLLFQVWFHLMTQLTLNPQWALNLVVLVW